MSLAIAGMGWITPLGNGVDSVWEQLLQGREASLSQIAEESADQSYNVFRVSDAALASAPHPRLRRASVISRFAAAAGLEALQTAGVTQSGTDRACLRDLERRRDLHETFLSRYH